MQAKDGDYDSRRNEMYRSKPIPHAVRPSWLILGFHLALETLRGDFMLQKTS